MKLFNRFIVFALTLCMTVTVQAVSPCISFRRGENNSREDSSITDDITPKRGKQSPEVRTEKTSTQKSASPQSWYFKRTTDNSRPPIPSDLSYIENYNGYFLGKDEKKIYLTFDAGYENGNVSKILDVLKEENVPGAFFVLENLVTKNTDLIKRMVDEGHTVCNHTASHKDMTKMGSIDEFSSELKKMEEIYKNTTGYDLSSYYRPPEGKFNEDNMRWANELGYKTIFWSFAYADWDNDKQPDREQAKEKILSGTHNGEVILLHPTSSTNAAILSDLIKSWKEMGYSFGTLDELTGE
ncbi:MAG: delta-lactam-biosynthetic de-N-acetylase [Ruminococcaceae bacterium]|nr:delta-lactam-biosynthetic de-N-acetylase [Oscillospiraceae bacterium]